MWHNDKIRTIHFVLAGLIILAIALFTALRKLPHEFTDSPELDGYVAGLNVCRVETYTWVGSIAL